MLLYVAFILLPAMALAECDKTPYRNLFTALDTDNSSTVSYCECEALFQLFDVNKNKEIALEEIVEQTKKYTPLLVGYERRLFSFLDHTKDRVISWKDMNKEFALIDTNEDGYKTKPEYETYLNKYCSSLALRRGK